MRFIVQPDAASRLGDALIAHLQKNWPRFRVAVAFAKRSGTQYLSDSLSAYVKAGGYPEVLVGIDHRGTSQEALEDLLQAVSPGGRIVVCHSNLPFTTFHPKVYVFSSPTSAEVFVGSGNLTKGGLFTNSEGTLTLSLDLSKESDAQLLASINAAMDDWADFKARTAFVLDAELLTQLAARGLVPVEALAAPDDSDPSGPVSSKAAVVAETPLGASASLFGSKKIPPAPSLSASTTAKGPGKSYGTGPSAGVTAVTGPKSKPIGPSVSTLLHSGFVMTLQQTDVGVGQKSAGKARRSPEIFIPLSARDADPNFWGWPSAFSEDPKRKGKFDRRGVVFRLGSSIFPVNMMTWPVKHDFRLRSERLRSQGSVGDILRVELAPVGSGYDYYAEVVPKGTTQYPVYLGRCTTAVKGSARRYGYY